MSLRRLPSPDKTDQKEPTGPDHQSILFRPGKSGSRHNEYHVSQNALSKDLLWNHSKEQSYPWVSPSLIWSMQKSPAYYTSSQKKLKYQKNVAMEFSGASAGSSSMQVRTGPFCLYATWNL